MKFKVNDPVRIVSNNYEHVCNTGRVMAVSEDPYTRWPYAVLLDNDVLPEGTVFNNYIEACAFENEDGDGLHVFDENELASPVVAGFGGSKLWGAIKGIFS